MKKHLSKIMIGCAGVCVGFALCYFSGSSPATFHKGNKGSDITIAADGSVSLAGTQVDLNQLAASLKKESAQKFTITIRADATTDFRRVIEVVDACKAAGVSRIAMRTSARP